MTEQEITTTVEDKTIEASISSSAQSLIQMAIEKGLPVETMERLLAMRRELRAEAAKEIFDRAMAKFQAECPVIEKTKEVKDINGKILYKYAPLDAIIQQVKEHLGNNGLSYAIQTEMTATHVKVTCIAKHEAGHSESATVDMPLANRTGIMNAPQQVASTLSFGKRYAFCNVLGIMTGDEDTDANEPKVQKSQTQPKPVAKPKAPISYGFCENHSVCKGVYWKRKAQDGRELLVCSKYPHSCKSMKPLTAEPKEADWSELAAKEPVEPTVEPIVEETPHAKQMREAREKRLASNLTPDPLQSSVETMAANMATG